MSSTSWIHLYRFKFMNACMKFFCGGNVLFLWLAFSMTKVVSLLFTGKMWGVTGARFWLAVLRLSCYICTTCHDLKVLIGKNKLFSRLYPKSGFSLVVLNLNKFKQLIWSCLVSAIVNVDHSWYLSMSLQLHSVSKKLCHFSSWLFRERLRDCNGQNTSPRLPDLVPA